MGWEEESDGRFFIKLLLYLHQCNDLKPLWYGFERASQHTPFFHKQKVCIGTLVNCSVDSLAKGE